MSDLDELDPLILPEEQETRPHKIPGFRFIGKLVVNENRLSSPEYGESIDLDKPREQWRQEIEAANLKYSSGDPFIAYNTLNYFEKKIRSGEKKKRHLHAKKELADAFDALDLPAKPSVAKVYLNHFFEWELVALEEGPFLLNKRQGGTFFPVAYHGAEPPEAMVQLPDIPSFSADGHATELSEADVAGVIADAIKNKSREDALAAFLNSDAKNFTTLYGTNVFQGLKSGELIDELIQHEVIREEGGLLLKVVR